MWNKASGSRSLAQLHLILFPLCTQLFLGTKSFVVNALSPVSAGGNQTCPLTCSQDSEDGRPGAGHTRPPVAFSCLLPCHKELYWDRPRRPLSYKVTSRRSIVGVISVPPFASPSNPCPLHTQHPAPDTPSLLWCGELRTSSGAAHFSPPLFKLTTL